jgi:hypothetical protein
MFRRMLLPIILVHAGVVTVHSEPQKPGPHGGVISLTGCVTQGKTQGSYELYNPKSEHEGTVHLTGSGDMKSEVGHKVKVTGKLEGSGDNDAQKSLNVDRIEKLSDKCSGDAMK